jgi:hypothetical protein
VHFSFKALILRVLCTRKISVLSPIFASGAGYARATRKNGMLPAGKLTHQLKINRAGVVFAMHP